MKKSLYLLLAAALLLFFACDSTEKIALTVDTGSASRAQLPVDPSISHVELAAFAAPITDGRILTRATVPVGERATLMVPADTNIEIFAAAMDEQQVLLPYFGLGSYYPAEMELSGDAGNTVEIWMEQMTYTFSSVSAYQAPMANMPSAFRIEWTYNFTDRFLATGLFSIQVERAITDPMANFPENMEIYDTVDLSAMFYDDTAPFSDGPPSSEETYWYDLRLRIPLLDLESPTSGPYDVLYGK